MEQWQEEPIVEQNVTIEQTKCPACGANMAFDIETGGLKCGHCHTKTDFNDNEKVQRRAITTDVLNQHQPWKEGKIFNCANCGAKEVLTAKEIARSCAFCGSSQISASNELPGIQPDSVIPFTITEESGRERFRKWIRSRWFAPRKFKREDVREHMQAMYTPCWSFTAMTENSYQGTLGRTVTISNGKQTRTTIRWFRVAGRVNQPYTDHFIQSGERITTKNFNRLKPYNLQTVRVYRQEFLSGIIAEHYSRTLEACFGDFSTFVKQDIRRLIIRRYRADHVSVLNIQTNFHDRKFNYVLLPLYISNYTYKQKLYNFYLNGATGKIVGKYPKSAGKIFGAIFATVAIAAAVAVTVFMLM